MTSRKGRPSFLRPLTQIAPQDGVATTPADLGTTSKGSIASFSQGDRPRSKSFTDKAGHAAPTSSFGIASPRSTPASSRAPSRRQSFAPHVESHRRPSMVAREATLSRRDSIWSTFGEDAPASGAVLTPEEKAIEARRAFVGSSKIIWQSGINRIVGDLWDSLIKGWKSGDIVGLFSIEDIGLTRVQHARAVVEFSAIGTQLQALAAASIALPSGAKAFRSLEPHDFDSFFEELSSSPEHVALLLHSLQTLAKLANPILPALIAHMEYPESLNPAFFSLINVVTFLAGSSNDLRRAIVALLALITEVLGVIESSSRAIIDITSRLPSSGAVLHPSGEFLYSPEHTMAQWAEIRGHVQTLLAQPTFTKVLTVFYAESRSTWNGLLGNAKVAKASRGVERILKNTSSGYQYKVASLLEALDVTEWEIDPITSDNEDFSYSFTGLRLHFPALVPSDVTASYSRGGLGEEAPTSLTLKGMHIVVKSAKYSITKRGLLGFTDNGSANLDVPLEIDVDLSEEVPAVVPRSDGKVIIELQSSSQNAPAALTKVWNAWLSHVVSANISESLETRIADAVKGWLEPLYGTSSIRAQASSVAAAAITGTSTAPITGQLVETPGSIPLSRQASLSRAWSLSASAAASPGLMAPSTAPVGARAAFLASLRMSSGIDIRPLATGRDVLESLANPFSGPNSAIGYAGADDEDDASSTGGLKSRSMSMAMSLTDVARTDSTAIENIENPPRSRDLSQMLLDDGSQPLEFNGLAGRRLSLAYTPAGEPSLDAYDQEIGYEASDPNSDLDGGRQRRMSMAEHLDERSQMDLTTPDSIAAQADRLSMDMDHGFPTDDIDASRANLSMTKVTMDLQGHKSPLSQDFHAAAQRKPVASPLGPSTAPATRRKSMSEYLSEAAMADTTDPTKNPGQRRPSRAQDAPTSRPTMSSVLDQVSSSDMTLHKNIASPPKSRQSSFAAGSASTRTTRKSFTALNDVPTMAEIGMDARISRDDTNTASSPGAKVSRRKSQAAADQYAGIDPAELKKRRMSSFMTDATNVDATLLHNIRNPPSVDQENHPAASTPHSLSSRRQSLATTA